MATLKDIAVATGLSTSSISRVLNFDDSLNISDENKRLIFQTAEELNYKTVNMRRQTEGTILIICTLSEQEELNDPYYISIRTGAESHCLEKKQKFKTIYLDQIDSIIVSQFAGLIIIGELPVEYMHIAEENAHKMVFVDTNAQNKDFNCVTVDLKHITKLAIDKLTESSRKVLYIGPFTERQEYDIRYTNFRLYMGLYKKEAYYLECGFNTFDAYNKLLSYDQLSEVEGIFCANDNIAIGVLKALNEMNISSPDNIQIIGVNDLPICEQTSPKLSSIKIHSNYMGELAVRRLIDLMVNQSEHRVNYVVHSKLVERETTN